MASDLKVVQRSIQRLLFGIGGGLAAFQVFTKTFLQQSVFVLQQLKVGQIP
ncbi:hypothetical protein HAALTHF_16840n [Vreelandella aquamarina]|nr:hypothetical protein HAALTHF_16840n [Halomonas axialensis]